MRGPLLLLLLLRLLCSLHTYSEAASWCYASQKSEVPDCLEPCQWGTDGNTCGGNKQSPIGISTKNAIFKDDLKPFAFEGYNNERDVTVTNNGHSVLANIDNSDASISGGGLDKPFKVTQFHLHWGDEKNGGSEHLIDSLRYPAELHIVHTVDGAAQDGLNLAVLAFFYKEAPGDNPNYKSLIEALKNIEHNASTTTINMKLKDLIPGVEKLNRYFRYEGSLTTPGCSETVIWTVFEEEIELSKNQIQAFSEHLYFPDSKTKMKNNYRPMQELNGRDVYRASASTLLLQGATIFITSAFVYLVTGLQH